MLMSGPLPTLGTNHMITAPHEPQPCTTNKPNNPADATDTGNEHQQQRMSPRNNQVTASDPADAAPVAMGAQKQTPGVLFWCDTVRRTVDLGLRLGASLYHLFFIILVYYF